MLIQADPLRRLVREIFVAAGCSPEESARTAEYLVRANLTGHDSHGVIRVRRYLELMAEGRLRPNQTITIVTENDVMAVLEGNFGFGQTIGPQAVQLGIGKAQKADVSVIALRHSGHLGRIGDWAEMAAAAGQVSIHFVNVSGSILVAPFGAVERRMATNPMAIGVPLPDEPPLILDFATAVVAEGKIMVAFSGGTPLPEGSLFDDGGRLTSDPTVFYGTRETTRAPNPQHGSGAFFRTSGPPVPIPDLSVAAQGGRGADGRDGIELPPGVWFPNEEARELVVFSEQYDLCHLSAPSR